MEHSDMGSDQYCFGCLCAKAEKSIHCLSLRNSVLKTVIQAECLFLCYLCRRASQQADLFIQNVQSNQILLQNVHSVEDSTINSVRSQSRAPHQLSTISLDIIEIGTTKSTEEESCFVYDHRGPKVKQEMKKEGAAFDDYDDHTDYQEPFVKEEDDFPLKELLKEEVMMMEVDLKSLKKSLRKEKFKKRKVKKDVVIKEEMEETAECEIETVYITREQCFEERELMSRDQRYLTATYKCTDCLKGFNFKESFHNHLEKHSKSNGDYECDVCKQRMSTENKLLSHKKYHERRYRCSVCGLTRVSRLTVKDHYSAFHSSNHYKHCTHCGKTFKRQVSWRKHIASAHGRTRVTCAYCEKSYANRDVLKAHMIVRHPTEVSAGEVSKPHVCQECGMAFKAPSQLKIHSVKHSLSRDYYCVECDKSFKSASILKHHLKTASTHVSYTELPLACEHCDKRFAIRRDLERHANRIHLNIKPFQCDRCEKVTEIEQWLTWSLNEHRRLVHEGFKRPLKYPCPMCDKVFDRNQILKGHIRTHTGERPYQCTRCPAQFTQPAYWGPT
ncbi:zinc finger protein 62-like [Leguminivora glycinivorella]|uniref:zinc finger protein 62-like n=1 Tax=Leguminivora glycinivorella TaxID=1035111 RepID=UPI00200E179B|nr:zinc finger protein 62-like [Leguminivora glycinivorella]